MKDKRQRLAMTWPCDPAVYAYLVNAAHAATRYPYVPTPPAGLPLFPPSSPAPLGYYSAGLQRVAAAAASSPYRSLPAGVDTAALRPGTAAILDRQQLRPDGPLSPPVNDTFSSDMQKLPGHMTMTSSTKMAAPVPLFQPFKPDLKSSECGS